MRIITIARTIGFAQLQDELFFHSRRNLARLSAHLESTAMQAALNNVVNSPTVEYTLLHAQLDANHFAVSFSMRKEKNAFQSRVYLLQLGNDLAPA